MKLSKESRYAVQGMVWLAQQPPGSVIEVAKIAEATELPPAFLAKIFRKLALHGVLTSHTGRGYMLGRAPNEIAASEIISAVEGPDIFTRCLFWSETCSDVEPCPFHDSWKVIRPQITAAMESTTLADLVGNDEHTRHPVPAPRVASPG